jgi:hypothetical protein
MKIIQGLAPQSLNRIINQNAKTKKDCYQVVNKRDSSSELSISFNSPV